MPRALIALAACVAAITVARPEARADEDKDEPPTISVSGTGKVSSSPDVAEISMGVLTSGPTAREAMSSNTQAMSSLLETLKQRGVASKDVQTTQIQVNPQYSQPAPGRNPQQQNEFIPRIVGYQVINSVRVTARDISKLGTVLDAVVQAGANQMHGISFRVDEPEKLLDEARKRAMADARRKAEQLAGEAGMVVGLPISIHEGGGAPPPPPPRPMLGRAMAMAAEAAVPVAGGEQELRVTVNVVYEIKPPK